MITKIEIENINSIEKCVIEFKPAKYKYLENMILDNKIVNPVTIYGHNGSGKSSIINALNDFVLMLTNSPEYVMTFTSNMIHVQQVLENIKSQEGKYKLSKEDLNKITSKIKIYYEVDNHNFEYCVKTLTIDEVIGEKLLCDEELIFNRTNDSYTFNGNKNKIEENEHRFLILRKLYMDEVKNDCIMQSYEFLSNIAVVPEDRKKCKFKPFLKKSYLDVMVEKSNEVASLYEKYETFPIYNIQKEDPVNNLGSVDTKAQYFVELKTSDSTFKLPYSLMSTGMFNQSMILTILLSLPKNGVLIVDELDKALHPSTIKNFLEVVKERRIQLIFSSHNTNVLQNLRPDQIFFAKWKNGFSTCYRLSDIYPNIREINNIEKMYLSNMFDDEMKNG